MGCTISKLDNEDTVRRCKDRRRFMKEALYARHHLAAAHSDYCRFLRLTGAALCTFSAGESLSVSGTTPAVFLTPPATANAASPTVNFHQRPLSPTSSHIRSPSPSLHPPKPFSPLPTPTIASSKLPNILSSSSVASSERRREQHQPPRRSQPPKLPHILSESSPSSSPQSQRSNFTTGFYPTAYQAHSTYSTTPSRASSVWNWENFYPPSPPDSEFFRNRSLSQQAHDQKHQLNNSHHLDTEDFDGDEDTERSEYDFNSTSHTHFVKKQNPHHLPHNFTEAEREEVQCSEWDDHYSTTSSSDDDHEEDGDADSRSEIGTRSKFGSSVRAESVTGISTKTASIASAAKMYGGDIKAEKTDDGVASSTASYRTEFSNMKILVRHKDLEEIVDAIKENFDKAAAAGDQVSELLEISKAQLDRNFSQLKKTVYHSSSVLSNLSSSWTSKPPLAVKYRLDTNTLVQPDGPKSLCSTLERLLAWEKKLCVEVKAREGVKIEHEKKLSALQSQEYKGEDETKLGKTKASIKRLQSLIVVTSQAVTTTSTAVLGLRDSALVPQLVELCHGFMYMWRSMHQYHEIQNDIVQQVRGLVDQSSKGDATSELHQQATRDLESTVSAWHSSFCRLIKFQRDFISSLHSWLKLTYLPVNNDELNSNTTREPTDVYAFCDEWKHALDRVPDTVASEAIKSFINVVHVISAQQSAEIKMKKRTETASKELEKKALSLRNIERKFYSSYSMVGIGLPDTGPDNGHMLDARDPLAEKKLELAACQRRVADEMVKHSKAKEVTKAMTLNHLQTGLPGVFQALTNFSSLFTDALGSVCTRSYAISR